MEPEALVQCPYDSSHRLRASRLPYHLVKCEQCLLSLLTPSHPQNNPQVARTLATCPFNARHRVPQAKLWSHVASCPDKRQPDLPHEMDMSLGDRAKQSDVPTAWQSPPCQEDWEAELEDLEDPPPFIFNVRMNDPLLLPRDRTPRGGVGHDTPRSPHRSGQHAELRGGDRFGAVRVEMETGVSPAGLPAHPITKLSVENQDARPHGFLSAKSFPLLQIPSRRPLPLAGERNPFSPPLPLCPQVENHPNPSPLQQFHVCFELCQQRPYNTCREFLLGGWIRPGRLEDWLIFIPEPDGKRQAFPSFFHLFCCSFRPGRSQRTPPPLLWGAGGFFPSAEAAGWEN
ncbi:gametocyte-specific factor 1 isoform X3 [Tyto alba]|uniref:gametocyte-specific factor 1 isoform X3 n=1 Tax=Tyto alba TaxID=56313 RepID=UPI001C6758D3|nr:gametocyte-specific factor 1 isoform X3 [Tyto alba]